MVNHHTDKAGLEYRSTAGLRQRQLNLSTEVAGLLAAAENTAAYAASVMRVYRSGSFWAKVVVAVAGVAPFMSKLTATVPSGAAWLAVSAPLVAVILPLWNVEKSLEDAGAAHERWASLVGPLSAVRRQIPAAITPADHAQLEQRLQELDQPIIEARKASARLPSWERVKKRSALRSPVDFQVVLPPDARSAATQIVPDPPSRDSRPLRLDAADLSGGGANETIEG